MKLRLSVWTLQGLVLGVVLTALGVDPWPAGVAILTAAVVDRVGRAVITASDSPRVPPCPTDPDVG